MKRTAQTTSLNKTVTTMFPNWKPNLTATKPKTALPWSVRKKIRQGGLDTKSSFRNDTLANLPGDKIGAGGPSRVGWLVAWVLWGPAAGVENG
jgi:hypothetical protein